MNAHDPDHINRLIGELMDLQEQWANDPANFDWKRLQTLAYRGANAYNEGAGPSFHALALDAVEHGEFHEQFLAYSLQAGFDPFKLSRIGSVTSEVPVIDHENLAEAAQWNPSSARMRAMLMQLARERFEPLVGEMRSTNPVYAHRMFRVVEACAESFPADLLEQLAPELAGPHHGEARMQMVDPVEGYLSTAEAIIERSFKTYG